MKFHPFLPFELASKVHRRLNESLEAAFVVHRIL